jgi:hypothetical protein
VGRVGESGNAWNASASFVTRVSGLGFISNRYPRQFCDQGRQVREREREREREKEKKREGEREVERKREREREREREKERER